MKRLVACLLVCVLMVAVLGACGQSSGEEKTDASTETTQKGDGQDANVQEVEDKEEDKKEVSGSVMMYSSMKDDQLAAIKEGFEAEYPNISFDYYTAGTGNVMTKIATEQQAGRINADIMWVGDPTHYATFKEQGILLPYVSPEAEFVPDSFKDEEDMYIGARIVTLGFVYNTSLVSAEDAPKKWEDLLDPKFKGRMTMTDPSFSGTTLTTVAGLIQNEKYGWEYFEGLYENGMELQQGSSAAVTTVGSGEYMVSIGVDYIAETLKSQGGAIEFVHPESDIPLVTSPIGIIKDTQNEEAAKCLYDFIISEKGQTILTETFTTPVREGVSIAGARPIAEIAANAAKVDDQKVIDEKEQILSKFDIVFGK